MLNDSFQKEMASFHEDWTNLFENFYPSVRSDLLNEGSKPIRRRKNCGTDNGVHQGNKKNGEIENHR
jgi:hypothetical protein